MSSAPVLCAYQLSYSDKSINPKGVIRISKVSKGEISLRLAGVAAIASLQ
jgi:hypothetical protein